MFARVSCRKLNVGCFVHSYVVVHNLRYNSGVRILFHERTFYLCALGVFTMSPNLLKSVGLVCTHGMHSDLGHPSKLS